MDRAAKRNDFISGESFRIASGRNPDCRFMNMDFFDIDESVGQFDAVWASGSLIHVPYGEMSHVLVSISKLPLENGIRSLILRDGSGKSRNTAARLVYRTWGMACSMRA